MTNDMYSKIIDFFKNPKYSILRLALMLIALQILKALLNNNKVYYFIVISSYIVICFVAIVLIPKFKDPSKR